jgi:ketosteroid isomerase-like protein
VRAGLRAALAAGHLAASGAVVAAESPPIPLHDTEPQFRAFVGSLRTAVRNRDAPAVHALLAPDYYVARDFGGAFDPSATPVRNFATRFELDDARLRPEYRGHGWAELRRAVSGDAVEKKRDGQLCIPHGALDRNPFPHSQLCFRRHPDGWRIQGHVNGGD